MVAEFRIKFNSLYVAKEMYKLTKSKQPKYNRNYRHMENNTIYSCLQKLIRVQ
jgi:hypothetical protein